MAASARIGTILVNTVYAALSAAVSFAAVLPATAAGTATTTAAVRLTSSDSAHAALGDGTALIMGASGVPIPSQQWVDTVRDVYLEPHGFGGTAQPLYTPELSSFTNTTETLGALLLTNAVMSQIAKGGVDADHPVVVSGYSQSAALTSLTMDQLHARGVPADDVHFVLMGDSASPNGGILTVFNPTPGSTLNLPGLDLTLGNPTPDNLYPTDVYTIEYDGFADFPRYSLNVLSDLNALIGMFYSHVGYLGLTPADIENAVALPTTADSLADYYMIPSQFLPVLVPLELMPVLGKPLYDLLEPTTRIMVNLGYGSITDGWNDGPANLETPASLLGPDINLGDLGVALFDATGKGLTDATRDLLDPATYQPTPLVDDPVVTPLIDAAVGAGFINKGDPNTLVDLFNAWAATWFAPPAQLSYDLSAIATALGADPIDLGHLFG